MLLMLKLHLDVLILWELLVLLFFFVIIKSSFFLNPIAQFYEKPFHAAWRFWDWRVDSKDAFRIIPAICWSFIFYCCFSLILLWLPSILISRVLQLNDWFDWTTDRLLLSVSSPSLSASLLNALPLLFALSFMSILVA